MSRFVAVAGRRGRFLVAEPLFERGAPQVGIGGGVRVRGGELIVAERHANRASVVAEIGDPERAADVAAAVIWERFGERGFEHAIEDAAADAVDHAEAVETERRDLTALDTFTVDPETARDFDDAVSASADGDGIRLWIHIADVAAHVRPGTALDEEAERRANSVYVPATVEPMLPLALSSGACSLSPGDDRLAVTVETVVGPDGRPGASELLPQPDPLRPAPRLRRSRRDLRRARDPAGGDRRAAAARPAGGRGAPRARAPARRSRSPPTSPSSSSTPTATWSGRSRSSRPRRTG